MDALTRAGYRAHARSAPFQRRLAVARAVIAAHAGHALSISWGKDSVALLAIVAEMMPDAQLLHARYETAAEVLPDLDAVRDAVLNRPEMRGLRYHEVRVPGEWQVFERVGHAFTEASRPAEREAQRWSSAAFQGAMGSALAQLGAAGAFLGLRAAESRARRITVAMRGLSYTRQDGRALALPIARWSGADVWAQLVSHDLPWMRIYDIARDRERARSDLTWASGGSGVTRYGAAAAWKAAYPDQIATWTRRWPELQGLAHV